MAGPELKGKATLDDSQMDAAFRRIAKGGQAAANAIGKSFGSIGGIILSPLRAIGSAVTSAIQPSAIADGVKNVFEAGRALAQMSRATGAGVKGLAILQAKFGMAGLGSEQVATSIFRLQKSIAGVEDEENKGGAGRLRQLGLDMEALQKAAPDKQLMIVGKAMAAIRDPAERNAAAMQIFGRAGAQLGAVFNGASFGSISPMLEAKAQMMARNAAIYEQVSIKLQRIGNLAKTFYAGVADQVVRTLDPILARLQNISFATLGQQLGYQLRQGTEIAFGIFEHPALIAGAVGAALNAAYATAGNTLTNVFKGSVEFFSTGMAAAFEGIGDLAISSLMEAFAKPIAFLQAGVETALQMAMSGDKFRDPAEEDRLQKKVDAARKNVEHPDDEYFSSKALHKLMGTTNADDLAASQAKLTDYRKLPKRESFDEIYARRQQEEISFGATGTGMTASQYRTQTKDRLTEGLDNLRAAARNNSGGDQFGAGAYLAQIARYAAYFRTAGAAAVAAVPMAAGSGPAAAAGPVRAFSSAQRVDMWNAAHSVGSSLDFDPSTRAGWTGAKNAYGQSGLGGGAYGRTGNIWTQLSGYGAAKGKTETQAMVGHLKDIATNTGTLAAGLSDGASNGGGGGGASATQ